MIWVILGVHIGCGIIAAGCFLAYSRVEFPRSYNYRDELGSSLLLGLVGGIVSLTIVFLLLDLQGTAGV
jgi:hypothetical protein